MNIKRFNESDENTIKLGNSVGRCVIDYCKIMDKDDYEMAKKYLKLWMGDIPNAKFNIINTLKYFKIDKNIIKTTKKLLDEL